MTSLVKILQELAAALFGAATETAPAGIVVQFFSWITSEAVLPFFGIGIAVSLVLLGVRLVRSVIWAA